LLSRINAQPESTPLYEAVLDGNAATVEAIVVAARPELIDLKDTVGYPMKHI